MRDQTWTLTPVTGTKQYITPEWFRSKLITANVDVYTCGHVPGDHQFRVMTEDKKPCMEYHTVLILLYASSVPQLLF